MRSSGMDKRLVVDKPTCFIYFYWLPLLLNADENGDSPSQSSLLLALVVCSHLKNQARKCLGSVLGTDTFLQSDTKPGASEFIRQED